MMYDVQLPGYGVLLIACKVCGARPEPEQAYTIADPPRWTQLLESGDKTAITAYLMQDQTVFRHGTRKDKPCPAIPLPGPALHKLAGHEAIAMADDLKALLLSQD
ncbi:hypothetical protein [Streptomyces sp. NBC_00827]|uniref:hypothetical protein n=1 Tax=Streptomyces sp. NBC_00827 TaxID=2903677 RepID=UPI00387047B2|nr:hypothetical protein OG569_12975 [Streptomyces sp. NBC_00827]